MGPRFNLPTLGEHGGEGSNVTPLFRPERPTPRLVATSLSPAERVLLSHKLIERAARDLNNGDPGSGVKHLAFAAATHLALTIGRDDAKAFFHMLAGVAGTEPDEPEPVA